MKRSIKFLCLLLLFGVSFGCASLRDCITGRDCSELKETMKAPPTVCDYIERKRVLVLASANAVGGYTQYFDQAVTQVNASLKECKAIPVMGPAGWNHQQMQQTTAMMKQNGQSFDFVLVVGVNEQYSQPTSSEQVWRTYADVRLMDTQFSIIESGDAEKDYQWSSQTGREKGFWRNMKDAFNFDYYNLTLNEIRRDRIKSMKDAVSSAIRQVVNSSLNEAFIPPKPPKSVKVERPASMERLDAPMNEPVIKKIRAKVL